MQLMGTRWEVFRANSCVVQFWIYTLVKIHLINKPKKMLSSTQLLSLTSRDIILILLDLALLSSCFLFFCVFVFFFALNLHAMLYLVSLLAIPKSTPQNLRCSIWHKRKIESDFWVNCSLHECRVLIFSYHLGFGEKTNRKNFKPKLFNILVVGYSVLGRQM